jgi:hypothetical protein
VAGSALSGLANLASLSGVGGAIPAKLSDALKGDLSSSSSGGVGGMMTPPPVLSAPAPRVSIPLKFSHARRYAVDRYRAACSRGQHTSVCDCVSTGSLVPVSILTLWLRWGI